ncbi:hypothetical protein GCM10010524_01180 [Streptomyces mexicanus]
MNDSGWCAYPTRHTAHPATPVSGSPRRMGRTQGATGECRVGGRMLRVGGKGVSALSRREIDVTADGWQRSYPVPTRGHVAPKPSAAEVDGEPVGGVRDPGGVGGGPGPRRRGRLVAFGALRSRRPPGEAARHAQTRPDDVSMDVTVQVDPRLLRTTQEPRRCAEARPTCLKPPSWVVHEGII